LGQGDTIMTTAKLRTWDGTKLTITDVQLESVPTDIARRTVAVHTGRMIVRRVYMEEEGRYVSPPRYGPVACSTNRCTRSLTTHEVATDHWKRSNTRGAASRRTEN
jgi:hypothetical protein